MVNSHACQGHCSTREPTSSVCSQVIVFQVWLWRDFYQARLRILQSPWSGPTLNYRPEFLKCRYLLELFYLALLPTVSVNSIAEREKYRPSTHSLQCVTQLRRSGIKIKPRKAESFLDIKYEKQVLQIPSITINDITSTVLINCVALEQCQERNIKYFSNYVSFMCCLISQPRDVALLGLDGVITNFSQDDQHVADLFNDLGKNTALNVRESYLWKVLHDVGAYYSSCWASMIRTYFSSPWSCILSVLCFCLVNAYHGTICNVCFKLLAWLEIMLAELSSRLNLETNA